MHCLASMLHLAASAIGRLKKRFQHPDRLRRDSSTCAPHWRLDRGTWDRWTVEPRAFEAPQGRPGIAETYLARTPAAGGSGRLTASRLRRGGRRAASAHRLLTMPPRYGRHSVKPDRGHDYDLNPTASELASLTALSIRLRRLA